MRGRRRATSDRAGTSPPWESTPTGLRSEWRLDAVPSSVTAMRWWLRAFLGQSRGLTPEEIDDLILVACEAASNAVEHPQRSNEPYFEVCTQIDGRAVTIVIRDHGHWRQPPSPEVSGRGFQLMRALADTTVVTDTHGTTVTIRHDPEGALGSGRRGHELTDTDAPG